MSAQDKPKNVLSGCLAGPGPKGEIITSKDGTVKPLRFMGATVLSFTANLGIGPTEESSLDMQLIEDCREGDSKDDEFQLPGKEKGDHFLGNLQIGSPVYFDTCEALGRDPKTKSCFSFGGFVENFTANQSSNGLLFNVKVNDPRRLLNGVTIVTGAMVNGPVKNYNYYNVYALAEKEILPINERFNWSFNPSRLLFPGTKQQENDSEAHIKDRGNNENGTCEYFGSSTHNDRGMKYIAVAELLSYMWPKDVYNKNGKHGIYVFATNYGKSFEPLLDNDDLVRAEMHNIMLHQHNIFCFDLDSLPLTDDNGAILEELKEFRVNADTITLMDFINNICNHLGREFIVKLAPPGDRHPDLYTIYVETKKPLDFDRAKSFKSDLLYYNGKSVEMSYGKEIRTDPTRTIMYGEQKHLMMETTDVLMYFGMDKDGQAIIPYTVSIVDDNGNLTKEDCSFFIQIYLDELQDRIRCPLYDYPGAPNHGSIVTRKVELSETHLRAALTSFDLWVKFVWNIGIQAGDETTYYGNTEDLSQIIRFNFPEYADFVRAYVTKEMDDSVAQNNQQPPPGGIDDPPRPTTDLPAAFFTDIGVFKSIGDMIVGDHTPEMFRMYVKQYMENLQNIHGWINEFARSHYGKTYLAGISHKVCTRVPEFLLNQDAKQDDGEIQFKNPCSNFTVTLPISTVGEKTYSHVPTNDGAWIEPCGTVLGLGSPPGLISMQSPFTTNTGTYLDFFRTDDGRVGPFARIDSKTFANLFDYEALIDDSWDYVESTVIPWLLGPGVNSSPLTYPLMIPVFGVGLPASWAQTIFKAIVSSTDDELWDLVQGGINVFRDRFYTGICGELDSKNISQENYVTIRDFPICAPPSPTSSAPYYALDLPSAHFIKFRVEEKIISTIKLTPFSTRRPFYQEQSYDECCGHYQNQYTIPRNGVHGDCFKSTKEEADQANADCKKSSPWIWNPPAFDESARKRMYIPIVFDSPLYKKDCDSLNIFEKATAASIEGTMRTRVDQSNANVAQREKSSPSAGIIPGNSTQIISVPQGSSVITKPNPGTNIENKVISSPTMCGSIQQETVNIIAAAMDSSAMENFNHFHPAAHIPDAVAIPLKSNMESYGPWASDNWYTSAGGVNHVKDNDLCPWVMGSAQKMNVIAKNLVKEQQVQMSEVETGTINYPYWPEIPLGFLDQANGPNLTRVNVNMGANGVSTNYTFQTYSPKFGGQASLEKELLKKSIENTNKIKKEARERERKQDVLRRKTVGNGVFPALGGPLPGITDTGTFDSRVLFGQIYPMQKIVRQRTITGEYVKDPCCGHYQSTSSKQPCYHSSNSDDTRTAEERNRACLEAGDDQKQQQTLTGYLDVATSDRTIIGGTSLEKSILEVRYDFHNKAFVSWDMLLGPVSVKGGWHDPRLGIDGPAGPFPMYSVYNIPKGSASGVFDSPNPPIRYNAEKKAQNPDLAKSKNSIYNIEISLKYSNPLTNPFEENQHHHKGAGAGHAIDVVAGGLTEGLPKLDILPFLIEQGAANPSLLNNDGTPNIDAIADSEFAFLLNNEANPINAVGRNFIKNLTTQKHWDKRYDPDYRFLALRGPLVLHQWGYDTQGKPIPNAIDHPDLIARSGVFRTTTSTSPEFPKSLSAGEGSGLQDYFLEEWLQQPSTWPVAPIDLRYDRKRGMWVSPPDYKIVVVEATEGISAYGSGTGKIINNRGDRKYNEKVYDSEGFEVKAATDDQNITQITIEDRLGNTVPTGSKSYAYFDSFTSTYLLMGGGGTGLRIGKFVNQWPALPNVKDPKNAVKEVQVFKKAPSCDGYTVDPTEDCPWALIPEMRLDANGVSQPVVEKVLNLMSNVAAAEYQTKWCVFGNVGGSNILISAEC